MYLLQFILTHYNIDNGQIGEAHTIISSNLK